MSRTVAIIQARMGSTRCPGKVLRRLVGRPMLAHVVRRVRAAPVDAVVVATSTSPLDDKIFEFCADNDIDCHRGSENDVLDRFHSAASTFDADPIIRVTADCPFVDPGLVGRLVREFSSSAYDYIAVQTGAGAAHLPGRRYPDGLDAECFGAATLDRAWREASAREEREHVTPYIWRNKHLFRCGQLEAEEDWSALRWTVDHEEDLRFAEAVYDALWQEDRVFTYLDVIELLRARPEIAALNARFVGKEGYDELWNVPRDRREPDVNQP